MIQPDYVEILGPAQAPPRTNFPRGYMAGYLAGPTDPLVDPIAKALNDMITGGSDPNAPGRQDRVAFYSDVLSQTGQKFVASDKGKATVEDLKGTVQKSIMTISIPLFIAGLAVGYLLGSRK